MHGEGCRAMGNFGKKFGNSWISGRSVSQSFCCSFGSFAYSEPHELSDVDVLVVYLDDAKK